MTPKLTHRLSNKCCAERYSSQQNCPPTTSIHPNRVKRHQFSSAEFVAKNNEEIAEKFRLQVKYLGPGCFGGTPYAFPIEQGGRLKPAEELLEH